MATLMHISVNFSSHQHTEFIGVVVAVSYCKKKC